jgi:hypothetical protein
MGLRQLASEAGRDLLANYSEFHDGFLDGLLLDDSSAHIFLSTYQKERFVIEASNVAALNAGDFKEGNIIFDVVIRNASELTLEDIEAVHGPFSEVSRSHYAKRCLDLALEKNLVLLEINPSYGATCLVLAATMDLCGRQSWVERHMLPKENLKVAND